MGEAQLRRDVARTFVLAQKLITQPVSRTEQLAGEDVRLNLLAFPRRIAFDAPSPAIDGVAAEAGRKYCTIASRVLNGK